MLSILVGHSYFMRFDAKQWERAKPYPPLATLQVASMLRAAGHEVALFDAMLAEGVDDFRRQLAAQRPQLVLVYEDNYNFLSKMCLARMREAACEMIAAAQIEGARVVVGGSDASDAPEPYLAAGADVVLRGEGLATLMELVSRLHSDPRISCTRLVAGLSGLVASLGETVVSFPGAPLLPLPPSELPAWDLVDLSRYRKVWLRAHAYFSLNMAASRGCPFRCTWCAKPIWGNQYLQRPAQDVAAEMIQLKRSYRPDHIWFADDIFGFRADWVLEFAAAVRESGDPVPFTIQTRADLVTERMASALRESGCREAWIGAESGSQRILDAMNKGTTVAQIHTARQRLRDVGIRVGFFIQLGYLGEDLSDILATRELVRDTQPDDIGVSVSYPLPGTRFHDLVREQLGRKTHWQDSGELAMMFRGTYTSEFYRRVRDLLHEQVTGHTGAPGTDRGGPAAIGERTSPLIERAWAELLSHEAQYRSFNIGPVASTG